MELLFEELVKKNGSQLFHIKKEFVIELIPHLQTDLIQIFEQLGEDTSWSFESSSRKDTSYATHGFHKYPAKFIPQLAKRCITDLTKKDETICDPFMGSGTTLIEALVSGRKAVGVDFNPIAWLISKAKTTPINPENLKKETEEILKDLDVVINNKINQKLLSEIKLKPIIPENERINYWFPQEETRKELGFILARINEVKNEDKRNFFLCAFSNILRGSSIWLMKSIKPTRDLNKKNTSPFKLFSRQIKAMLRGNETLWNILPKEVKTKLKEYSIVKKQDARKLPCEDGSVNLIVTSPPYVTSYEYADLHQLSALWLGYTNNVSEFRDGFIGSIHKKDFDHNGIRSKIGKQEIVELSKISKRESESVRNYFFEMQECFEEMYRVLKPNGKACIVIGNTALKKVPILNAEVFTEIMLNIGFKIHKIIKRKIPSKVLPQTRNSTNGRFSATQEADRLAYAYEYILIMEKM